jgi:hypothetical protein
LKTVTFVDPFLAISRHISQICTEKRQEASCHFSTDIVPTNEKRRIALQIIWQIQKLLDLSGKQAGWRTGSRPKPIKSYHFKPVFNVVSLSLLRSLVLL